MEKFIKQGNGNTYSVVETVKIETDNKYYMCGPMRCSVGVLEEASKPIFSHRTAKFREVYKGIIDKVGQILYTKGRVVPTVLSGTGGNEFMISNLIHPNDRVLCLINGHFSERLYQQAQNYSKHVDVLKVPEGDVVTSKELEEYLKGDGETKLPSSEPLSRLTSYDVVTVVSSETSTGAWTDMKALSELCRKHGIMLLVDHVSGVGNPYCMDEWGIDATTTTTHESFFAPPSFAIVAFSDRAVKKAEKTPKRNLYMNLLHYLKSIDSRGEPPFTVPTTLAVGLNKNLSLILEEGIENYIKRCEQMAITLREGLQKIGIETFTKKHAYNNTITAFKSPFNAVEFVGGLREKFGINVSTGKGLLKGKIFRVSHCGVTQLEDIKTLIETIKLFVEDHRFLFYRSPF